MTIRPNVNKNINILKDPATHLDTIHQQISMNIDHANAIIKKT
jgi:hypothetical protein